jgi:hypothetical protein
LRRRSPLSRRLGASGVRGDAIHADRQPAFDAQGVFRERKVVAPVDAVDTFVGMALLFAAVAIGLRVAQNAILGRARAYDPRTGATHRMADR